MGNSSLFDKQLKKLVIDITIFIITIKQIIRKLFIKTNKSNTHKREPIKLLIQLYI